MQSSHICIEIGHEKGRSGLKLLLLVLSVAAGSDVDWPGSMIQVVDLGYAAELGNYGGYGGAPKEEECVTDDPDGRKRALLIGGGIVNFTDVATTFCGIIRALREKIQYNSRKSRC